MQLGPGSAARALPPWRKKKYHERVAQACDECRSRRRKCDSQLPCGGCTLMNHSCSYNSSHGVQSPTPKVHHLVAKIQRAQAVITRCKLSSGKIDAADLDAIVRALEYEVAPLEVESFASRSTAESPDVDSGMPGCGRLASYHGTGHTFFGPSSGFAFIGHILELFQNSSSAGPTNPGFNTTLIDLFDLPFPADQNQHTLTASFKHLPRRSVLWNMLDSLYARFLPVAELIAKEDARELLELAYQSLPLETTSFNDGLLLFAHAFAALGFLYHATSHKISGCQNATDEAIQHFSSVRSKLDIMRCDSLLSLQTLLCLVFFLISTSRLTAAHAYLGVTYSSAIRLGLFSSGFISCLTSNEKLGQWMRVYFTLHKYDLYLSLVLGLPSFIDAQHWQEDLMAFYTQPLLEVETQHERLTLQLSVQSLKVLKLTQSGLCAIFPQASTKDRSDHANKGCSVHIKTLEDLRIRLKNGAKESSLILNQSSTSPETDLLRYELDMTFSLCQIMLYQPFLHNLAKIAGGEALARTKFQYALACIKISANALERSESMMRSGDFCPASWVQIYTIFLSVVNLIFLIAAHNGTSRPSEAWKKALGGIKLLAANRCSDNGASACLTILQKLAYELSHTVDFDFDLIRSSTVRLCENSSIQRGIYEGETQDVNFNSPWLEKADSFDVPTRTEDKTSAGTLPDWDCGAGAHLFDVYSDLWLSDAYRDADTILDWACDTSL